jgi:hypothetical protein
MAWTISPHLISSHLTNSAASSTAMHRTIAWHDMTALARKPLHHYITISLHHCNIAPLHHCNIAPLHPCITASLHHCITASLHHCITTSLHHCTTASLTSRATLKYKWAWQLWWATSRSFLYWIVVWRTRKTTNINNEVSTGLMMSANDPRDHLERSTKQLQYCHPLGNNSSR